MPMDHAAVITTITDALRPAPEIRALFLGGSYGTGQADAYSDIDFVLVTPDGSTDHITALWRQAVEQTGDIILWWDNKPNSVLINAITADWTRTDVIIQTPEQMTTRAQDALKPLFDHDDLYSGLRKTTPYTPRTPARFTHQVEDFIRIIGLTPLALGREEYLNGVLGVQFLRNALVDLLIEENEVADRGGILHLNRLITADQKALLMSMPTPAPAAKDIIAANLAYAAAYLPRARKMAAQLGADWPELFEATTWAHLKDTLGLQKPYDPD